MARGDDGDDDPQAGLGLPAWTYRDADFFAAEAARVIRPSWQIVCHLSDIARPGDWRTLELLGESVLVIRGDDGRVRAFANVCRHRGSRLVDGDAGCAARLVCPYHAWSYALDGRLTGVPSRADYPGLDPAAHGLVPIELEVWQAFVFVRLVPGGPSVAAMMAPFAAEVEPYRFAELRAIGRLTLRPRAVNWKNVGDNYADALHIPVAHPGLTRLLGRSYGLEHHGDVDRMWGDLAARDHGTASERWYRRVLPAVDHLPAQQRRLWLYYRLWPNTAFDIYPDQIDFMQWLPVSPTETLIREIGYALPDDRREMRLARALNWRINRQVNAEDTRLIARVQAGMASASFVQGPLGTGEVALRAFAARVRRLIPEALSPVPPPPGWSRQPAPARAAA